MTKPETDAEKYARKFAAMDQGHAPTEYQKGEEASKLALKLRDARTQAANRRKNNVWKTLQRPPLTQEQKRAQRVKFVMGKLNSKHANKGKAFVRSMAESIVEGPSKAPRKPPKAPEGKPVAVPPILRKVCLSDDKGLKPL